MPFLTAEWRDLVMLNYEVDADLLKPHVPRGTSLDRWEDRLFLSLVAFRFEKTRVLGVPVPGHRDFEEVNLRFYVRRDSDAGPRRAVTFLRELVPRTAIAAVARLVYNEPYRALPMRHAIGESNGARWLRYEWRETTDWIGVESRTQGAPVPLVSGSHAEFITEHFWGYTAQRDGGTVEYEVTHPRWRVWEQASATLIGDLSRTYGAGLGEVLRQQPYSVLVAEGSPVAVMRARRIA